MNQHKKKKKKCFWNFCIYFFNFLIYDKNSSFFFLNCFFLFLADRLSDVDPVYTPGPAGSAEDFESIEQFWNGLFSSEIIKIIVEHTNAEIENHCANLIERGQDTQTYHHHTDEEEIRAYIAVLYYIGAWKSAGVSTHDLWSNQNGVNFYRCVMPRTRFMFLSSCLRFDDKSTRNLNDRFSHIREIWEIFISNCTNCYEPSRHCTIDEILLGFRGRSKFRMYIKSKPDKYGLKFFALNDPSTSYLIYALPYLGKIRLDDKLEGEQLSEYYFRKTTDPIHGTNRTVTCDNWFTSVPLLKRMTEEPYKLKITGTIKKNKREISAEMKVSAKTASGAKFCYADGMTLVSYTPKKKKIVLVISSYKSTDAIENQKSVIISHYNATKGGRSTGCAIHSEFTEQSLASKGFFGMLDMAAVNARILLKCKLMRDGITRRLTAKKCLDALIMHLVTPHMIRRSKEPSLRIALRVSINTILNQNEEPVVEKRIELASRKRCGLCKRDSDRKTKFQCPSCLRPMCDEHRTYLCIDCAGQD